MTAANLAPVPFRMPILAIDTALEACSVAIATATGLVMTRSETIGRGHAERLFGMVADMLAEADTTIDAIDRFVVTIGPGSFTGIRVGIAAVRGFALVTGRPSVGVSTLAAHAAVARRNGRGHPVLAALPAKGDEVFAQLFAADGATRSEPAALSAGDAARLAIHNGADVAGAGADAIAAVWPSMHQPFIVHRLSSPDIAAVLDLGAIAPADAGPPRPLYIRPPDAIPASNFAVARR